MIQGVGREWFDCLEGLVSDCVLVPKVEAGPDAPGAQQGKEAVFSEVYGYSMVRNERYKMVVESRTRQPLELYDMVNDPRELRNLENEPSLENLCERFLNEYFGQLLASLDKAKLKAFQEAPSVPLSDTFLHDLMRRPARA